MGLETSDFMIRRNLPNCITLANLLCGTLSVYFLYTSPRAPFPVLPSVLIILGAVFDFFDGFTARALKVSSPIGKELDSLADVVTFGLAPSLICVEMMKFSTPDTLVWRFVCLVPLFMVLMSGFRLAKFNLDDRQTTGFIGLPTPANALLWLSLPFLLNLSYHKVHLWGWYSESVYQTMTSFLTNPYFILVCSVAMGVLLVSELPFFALKFKTFAWRDNKLKFGFLIFAAVALLAFNCFAIPIIVLAYIILSIIKTQIKK